MDKDSVSISLVLGSGGARGLTHIGIIRWLEDNGYRIDSISGSSIGALVGGIHAMGKLEEFVSWATAINHAEMFRLLDFTLGSAGLVKGEKIIASLRELTGEALIEELPIPFTAVASDVVQEREVWISRGPLFDAIRASIAIPLFFAPVRYRGRDLLDGGVLNPVPIAPTFRDHTDQTIAVNLSGPVDVSVKLPSASPADESEDSFFSRKVSQFVESLRKDGSPDGLTGMYDVALQAIDAMEGAIGRQKLAAYPPDHVVTVPRSLCGIMEFDQAQALIEKGYELAGQQLRPAVTVQPRTEDEK
ncbi:MAG: patatin-like phospholipase family protein [Pseudomonadota bacterium]